ncbi:MAG: rhodanese-like domain-containing protein [Eudoraea sp.]|nr:rhodanese-like domain-containing protein [Eudoraea sp.]
MKYNTFGIQSNTMRNIWISLFIVALAAGCANTNSLSITDFSQEGLEDYTLLDVRTPEEFAEGHLENAVNINWFDTDFVDQLKVVPKEHTLYVYCRSGGRSAKATALLDSLGFKAINLTGGYNAFQAE